MTRSSPSHPDPEPRPQPRRWWLRALLLGGGVTLIGLVAVGWWAWRFIHEQLAPLVSENLSKTFDRPVEVGPLEQVWLDQLTFGESAIPATATDRDRATVESVQVQFNLLELLWDRTLSLDVTLVRPQVYLQQDRDGVWIATQIQEGDSEEGPIKIELDTLRIQDGNAQLAPYGEVESSQPVELDGSAPEDAVDESDRNDAPETLPRELAADALVELRDLNGAVTFRDNNQRIGYDVSGRPDSGGRLRVQGETQLAGPETVLRVTSRDLQASDLSLLAPLPLKLQAGRISSDLEVQFPPNNQPLQFDGSLQLKDIAASLDGVPKPFEQVNGQLNFAGQRIGFENFQGRYGAIPAQISGSLDTQRGYDLQVKVPRASVADILETVDVAAADLPIPLAGVFQTEVSVTGGINQPLVNGTARNLEPVEIDRLQFSRTQASFSVTPQAVLVQAFEALPSQGGRVTATGRVDLGERPGLVVDLRASNLPGDAIAQRYGVQSDNFTIGAVNASTQVIGPLNNVQTIVQWQAPQATYPGRGRVVLAGSDVQFEDTAVLVANGIVRGSGQIRDGQWQALLNASGIELRQFSAELRGLFSGDVKLAGRLDNLDPAAIRADAQLRFSEGLALITDPLQASVRWLGDRLQIVEATSRNFQADGLVFARLTGAGAPAINNLDVNVALQNYRLTDLPVTLPPQLRLAGTSDFAGRISGPLDAITVAGQLGLNDLAVNTFVFEPRLSGELRYALNQGLAVDLSGDQDRIAVQLDGRNRPRSFEIRQGETVAIGQGDGDRLEGSLKNFPLLALNLAPVEGYGPVVGQLNGSFNANIADLSNPAVVGTVAVVDPGLGDLTPRFLPPIDETADRCSPTIVQAVQQVNSDFTAQPDPTAENCPRGLFIGQFSYIDRVATLAENSRLLFGGSRYALSGVFDPAAETLFQGRLLAEVGRIEDIVALLRWYEIADLGRFGPPTYSSAAEVAPVAVDVNQQTLLNRLRRYSELEALYTQQVIARQDGSLFPELASLRGGFTGEVDLSYSNAQGLDLAFDLGGQNWLWGDCAALPVAPIEPEDGLPQGNPDLDRAEWVNADPAALDRPNTPTGTSLTDTADFASDSANFRINPAAASFQRCQQYQVDQVIAKGGFENGVLTLLPVELRSSDSLLTFSGQLGGAQQSGQLIAENIPVAVLRDLFNSPIDITGQLNATATLGGSVQNPQFEGEINLVEGQISRVSDTGVQVEAIPPLRSLFGYNNARLAFDTRFVPLPDPEAAIANGETAGSDESENQANQRPPVQTAADDSFLFTGSIPYKLPFATVPPDDYRLSLDLNLQDSRLALINLLTDQVSWEGGQGQVVLQVRGTLPPDRLDFGSLSASGTAEFTNAQIGAKALPEDLTNVNGTVLFERDRLRVADAVTGQLGQGEVQVTGVLPLQYALSEFDPDAQTPLTVSLNDLAIDLNDLYDGGVNGTVTVTGSALAPVIGGDILLSNGRILIPGQEAAGPAGTATAALPQNGQSGQSNLFRPPQYSALRVRLGDRLRVTYDPVLSFVVRGDLDVSGTQLDPLLDGRVYLRSGQVNLFTTQFNLERGYSSTADFSSERGLDPFLDVQLVTSVPEVTRFPSTTPSAFPNSEIVDTATAGDFGAIQTVRVQARVNGPASQLFEELELTSSPRRSETEILALLGGIGNLQGSATTALASIAGSPLLNGIQNLVNDTFGISDFRLFPTTIISDDARTTSLALATELGFDITRNLSVSVLQLLTVREPTQFSLRYRLTDQLLLRGSTNLNGEGRAVLEFETRF